MKSDAQDIFKSTKSTEEACVACFAANESDESCWHCVSLKCERTCADTYAMLPSRLKARFKIDSASALYTATALYIDR
jgi:hypothetical protein